MQLFYVFRYCELEARGELYPKSIHALNFIIRNFKDNGIGLK